MPSRHPSPIPPPHTTLLTDSPPTDDREKRDTKMTFFLLYPTTIRVQKTVILHIPALKLAYVIFFNYLCTQQRAANNCNR
jgi:hypothetical protein